MSFSSDRVDGLSETPKTIASDGTGNLVAALRKAVDERIVLVRFASDDETILRGSPDRLSSKSDFLRTGTVTASNIRVVLSGAAGDDDAPLPDLRIRVSSVPDAVDVRTFLSGDHGGRIVSAMHHDQGYEVPAQSDILHQRVAQETGVYPALYSADFLTGATVPFRQNMIDEVVRQWRTGTLVQIMFHVSPPQYPVEEESAGGWGTDAAAETLPGPNRIFSYLNNAQWDELMTAGSTLHLSWQARVDEYARYLVQLQDAGVVVLLRPFHEMNQHVFWWGGRPGRGGSAGLYRMFRERVENHWRLRNILWVWNVQDLPDDYGFRGGDEKFSRYDGLVGGLDEYDADDWDAFNPGADAYDILSVDFYDAEGYSARRYAQAKRIAEADGKPLIIGETFVFPTAAELAEQPAWKLAMPWGLRTWRHNTYAAMTRFYRGSMGASDLPRFRDHARES